MTDNNEELIIPNNINSLNLNVSKIRQKLYNINSNVNKIDNSINTINDNIDFINNDIDNINNKIENIETSINSEEGEIKTGNIEIKTGILNENIEETDEPNRIVNKKYVDDKISSSGNVDFNGQNDFKGKNNRSITTQGSIEVGVDDNTDNPTIILHPSGIIECNRIETNNGIISEVKSEDGDNAIINKKFLVDYINEHGGGGVDPSQTLNLKNNLSLTAKGSIYVGYNEDTEEKTIELNKNGNINIKNGIIRDTILDSDNNKSIINKEYIDTKLTSYATKTDLNDYTTNSDFNDFKSEVSDTYATKETVNSFNTRITNNETNITNIINGSSVLSSLNVNNNLNVDNNGNIDGQNIVGISYKTKNSSNIFAENDTDNNKTKIINISSISSDKVNVNNKEITDTTKTTNDNDDKIITTKKYVDTQILNNKFDPSENLELTGKLTLSGDPNSLEVNKKASFNDETTFNSNITCNTLTSGTNENQIKLNSTNGDISGKTLTVSSDISGNSLDVSNGSSGNINCKSLTLNNQTINSIITGSSNNNKLITQGYVDDNNVGKKEYDNNVLKGEIFNIYSGDDKNIASGVYSHAEGRKTKATQSYAHAEGNQTEASGLNSHAEGLGTKASGLYSHAEGGNTEASADYSHAEGQHTKAINNMSHASGHYTIAYNRYMTSVGKFNIEGTKSTNDGKLFVVGNGSDINNRSDAFVVKDDGNTIIKTGLYIEDKNVLIKDNSNINLLNINNASVSSLTLPCDSSTITINNIDKKSNETENVSIYTTGKIDDLLSTKANTSDLNSYVLNSRIDSESNDGIYSKSKTNELFYTKTEINGLLDDKVNVSSLETTGSSDSNKIYTKDKTDLLLSTKADVDNTGNISSVSFSTIPSDSNLNSLHNSAENIFAKSDNNQENKTILQNISSLSINNKEIIDIKINDTTQTETDDKTITSKKYVDTQILNNKFDPSENLELTGKLTLSGNLNSLEVNHNSAFNGDININTNKMYYTNSTNELKFKPINSKFINNSNAEVGNLTSNNTTLKLSAYNTDLTTNNLLLLSGQGDALDTQTYNKGININNNGIEIKGDTTFDNNITCNTITAGTGENQMSISFNPSNGNINISGKALNSTTDAFFNNQLVVNGEFIGNSVNVSYYGTCSEGEIRCNLFTIINNNTVKTINNIITGGNINNDKLITQGYIDYNKPGLKEYDNNVLKGEIFNVYSGDDKNIASGNYSHAEGYKTTASGNYSHAEGYKTEASGYYSHAEGIETTASEYSSHAEGSTTTASGDSSHAEGLETTASGNNSSHAEGYKTEATGNYGSHAEGYETEATGNFGSHAEGMRTTASGYCSHAEGLETTASGYYSHVGGSHTYADNSYMTVIGKYNKYRVNDPSYNEGKLFVVGNGTSDNLRNDAFVIKNDGECNIDGKCNINKNIIINTSQPIDTLLYVYNQITSSSITLSKYFFDFSNQLLINYEYINNNIYFKTYNLITNEYNNGYSTDITNFTNNIYMIYSSNCIFIYKKDNDTYSDFIFLYKNIETYRTNIVMNDNNTFTFNYKNNILLDSINYTIIDIYDTYYWGSKYGYFLLKVQNNDDNNNYIVICSCPLLGNPLNFSTYTWSESINYLNNYNKYISVYQEDRVSSSSFKDNGFFVSYNETNNETYIITKLDALIDETNKKTYNGYAFINRYANNIYVLINYYFDGDNNNYILKVYSINNNSLDISTDPSYTFTLPNNSNIVYKYKSIYFDGYILYIIVNDNNANKYYIRLYKLNANLLKELEISTDDGQFHQYNNSTPLNGITNYTTLWVSSNNNNYILFNSNYNSFNHISNNTIFYNDVIFNRNVIYQNTILPVPTQQNNRNIIKSNKSINDTEILSVCNDNNYIYTLLKDDTYYYINKQKYNNETTLITYLLLTEYNIKNIYVFNDNLLFITDNGLYYINLIATNSQPILILNDTHINKLVLSPDKYTLYVLYNSYDYYSTYDLSLTNKQDYQEFTSDKGYTQDDLNIIDIVFYANKTYFIHNLYNENFIVYSDYSNRNNIIRKQINITLSRNYSILDSYVYDNYVYLLLKNNTNIQLLRINNETNEYNIYDKIIIDKLTILNKYIYYKYNSEYFYLISENYIYYYNVSDKLLNLENKLYVNNCKYITNNQDIYLTDTNIYKFTNNFIVNGDILLNGHIKTSTLNAIQLNLSEIDVNINKTITHNSLIDGSIENYQIGSPIFLLENQIYSLERISNDGKYPIYKYIEINDNNYIKNTINQMPKITYEYNGKFIGVITAIYPKNTPLKLNEITNNYIKIDNDTIDFATHGDYVFKVDNNTIEHQTTSGSMKVYEIGDEILYDGRIVDPNFPLTRKIEKMIVGTITYIPNNTGYVSVFKN